MLVGGLAGFVPDLDVLLVQPSDPLSEFLYHRHFTHSIVMMPIIGLLAWLPFLAFKRYRDVRMPLLIAGIAGAITHAPLDTMTAYGTQILWPFTNKRFATDWLPIIDPVYTCTLIACLIYAGRKKTLLSQRMGVIVSLVFFSLGILQHYRASSAQGRIADSRGHQIERGRVMALPLSLLLWRSVYEFEGVLYVDGFRTGPLSSTRWREGGSKALLVESDLPEVIVTDPDALRAYRVFSWFADGYVGRVDADLFQVGDFRYVMDAELMMPLWGVEIDRSHTRSVMRTRYNLPGGRGAAILGGLVSNAGYLELP